MKWNKTPNHALQRTAPAVTLAASGLRLSPHHAASAPASAVAELGVVRPTNKAHRHHYEDSNKHLPVLRKTNHDIGG